MCSWIHGKCSTITWHKQARCLDSRLEHSWDSTVGRNREIDETKTCWKLQENSEKQPIFQFWAGSVSWLTVYKSAYGPKGWRSVYKYKQQTYVCSWKDTGLFLDMIGTALLKKSGAIIINKGGEWLVSKRYWNCLNHRQKPWSGHSLYIGEKRKDEIFVGTEYSTG